MLHEGMVERDKLLGLFAAIEPQLYTYPAIDAATFAANVRAALKADLR